MAVDALFRSKQSEDPHAENRKPTLLYNSLYFTRWVKYCIDHQRDWRNDFCVCPFPIKRSTTPSKFSVYFYYPNWTGGSSANLRQAWYGLTTKEYAQNVTCYPSLSPILLTNDSLRCSRSSSEKTYPVILNCYKKKVLCTRMVIQTTFSSSHHLLNLHSFLYIWIDQ